MLNRLCDDTFNKDDILQLLHDAGCPTEFRKQFLNAMETQSVPYQLRLLATQRTCLLEQVHIEQKKLDRLDDLRYIIERQNRKK